MAFSIAQQSRSACISQKQQQRCSTSGRNLASGSLAPLNAAAPAAVPDASVATARRPLHVCAAVTAERAAMDIKKMEPLHDRVLIKPFEEEPKTAAGILLPKGPPKSNSDAHFGEVLAIGSSVTLPLAVGDKVVFNKYAMAEVEVPDGDILFVAEKSILGKLE